MAYEIVIAVDLPGSEFYGRRGGNYNADIGLENEFETIPDALRGIESLQNLGGELADSCYRVREIGGRWPS